MWGKLLRLLGSLILVAMGGCGGGPRYGSVFSAAVSTAELPSNGGAVTIEAQVRDTNTSQVYALLTLGGTPALRIDLTNTTGSTYAGTVKLPANPGVGDQVYRVRVYARNLLNELLGPVSGGTITVRGSGTAKDLPPTFTAFDLSPSSLPPAGGNVAVTVEVQDNDDTPVKTVYLVVIRPDTTTEQVNLTRTSGTAQAGTYQGQFLAPENPEVGAALYAVVAHAEDTADQKTGPIFVGNVSVAGKGTSVDQPPSISQATVTPENLPFEGGSITLSATVTDPDASGVESVFAEIIQPDSTIHRVSLARIAGDAAHGTYGGTLDLPGNPGGTAQTYEVVLNARDTASLLATPVHAGQVTVAGVSTPPEPPED